MGLEEAYTAGGWGCSLREAAAPSPQTFMMPQTVLWVCHLLPPKGGLE